MFNDTAFYYSEERRKDLLGDAELIRVKRELKAAQRKEAGELLRKNFAQYMKMALAAIFHR